MKKKNIILIGFMGSGKTSVGLKLSFRMRMPVEDTDKLIEKKEMKSITDIFADEGEAYFRRTETELLKELLEKKSGKVYSLGGGTPVREENREYIRKLGLVVYLRALPDTIYDRLKGDTTRPLLQCEDPRKRIAEMMEQRREAYESCADLILDVDNMKMEQILVEIKERFDNENFSN